MEFEKLIETCKAEIGITEKPINNVKYNDWYYGKHVEGKDFPWCAVFVAWVFEFAGLKNKLVNVSNKAWCPSYVYTARKAGEWSTIPQKGALALFDWNKDGVADHIGIVTHIDADYIYTVEGNTSTTDNANGGCVMARKRRRDTTILGYWNIKYDSKIDLKPETVLSYVSGTLKGAFGNGEERKKKLGVYYDKVQRIINILYEKGN